MNHAVNFLDPISGAQAQDVECFWPIIKKTMRKEGAMHTRDNLFQTYLPEYLLERKLHSADSFIQNKMGGKKNGGKKTNKQTYPL